MGMSGMFRKIPVLAQLSRRKRTRLGDSEYRIRSVFVNELALRDSVLDAEPSLNVVYRAALKCKPGAFVDVGANIGQTLFKVLSLDKTRSNELRRDRVELEGWVLRSVRRIFRGRACEQLDSE